MVPSHVDLNLDLRLSQPYEPNQSLFKVDGDRGMDSNPAAASTGMKGAHRNEVAKGNPMEGDEGQPNCLVDGRVAVVALTVGLPHVAFRR